jgi:hypothetical protein
MSPILSRAWLRAVSVVERQKSVIVLAVVIALTSSGTAAAVSYVVLGGSNQTNLTTILRSNVNGAVLQVANNDTTGGASTKGLNITVPTGRAPIWVNPTAGKATNLNADLLDGQNASAFLGVNQTAANSDQLNGMDSSQFVSGKAHVSGSAFALCAGCISPVLWGGATDTDIYWGIGYVCPETLTQNGSYRFLANPGNGNVNLFIDQGLADPEFLSWPSGVELTRPTNASGEWVHIQVQSGLGWIADIDMFSVHRATDCHVQGVATTKLP